MSDAVTSTQLSKWPRLLEVIAYAEKYGCTIEEAIQSLVNSGLSHSYPRTVPSYYVMSLRDKAGLSYESLHFTREGAEAKLRKITAEWGWGDLDNLPDGYEYGISYLPVEK